MNTTPSPAREATEYPTLADRTDNPNDVNTLLVPFVEMERILARLPATDDAPTAKRRHDEFDLMLSTLRYIVGAEPAAAGTTARDHYNAVVKALGAWPSRPEHAAKRIDAMLEKFPEMSHVAPTGEPVAWVLFRRDDDGLEPIQLYGGAEKPGGEFKDRFELRPVYFAAKQEEVDKMREHVAILRKALDDASSHLDYVGYGDSWERECATAGGLQDRIEEALQFGQPAPEPEPIAPVELVRFRNKRVACPHCEHRPRGAEGLADHIKVKHATLSPSQQGEPR